MVIMLFTAIYLYNLKRDFLYKVIAKKFVNKPLFSTIVVLDLIKYIFQKNKNKKIEILKHIQNNNFLKLIDEIDDCKLKVKLDLILNGKENEYLYADEIYQLLVIQNKLNNDNFDGVIEILNHPFLEKNKNNKVLALKYMVQAKIALSEGDLLISSEKAARALKILKKYNMLFEEAECYFLLGNIYRMAGIFDSSEFMLRSSLKIFKILGSYSKEVETLGTLGLLMAVQKRFSEALEYYKSAEQVLKNTDNSELLCYILGQQALLDLIQNNYKSANNTAINALKYGIINQWLIL